jgi:reverse gyrase
MDENYDNICAICGGKINGEVAYYCCTKCQQKHKRLVKIAKVTESERNEGSDAANPKE